MTAAFDGLAARHGIHIDSALVASRLGPPLDVELAYWAPAEQIPELIDSFRSSYPELAVTPSPAFPGAIAALDAVRALGGRILIITGKFEPNAALHLAHLELPHDRLAGTRWGNGKSEILLEESAQVYVGDHAGDMLSAKAVGAVAVGIPTGGMTEAELRNAGADVVLESLAQFPDWLAQFELRRRTAALLAGLSTYAEVLVAFSGGADSALVLAAAVRALGAERVVAATAVSTSLPAAELAAAQEFAATLGVRHLLAQTNEMQREGYRQNAGDRCYFCKSELLDVMAPLAAELGISTIATGTNADDALAAFRPGIKAAAERGAVTPLLSAGLSKDQVRAISKQWGLRTWDKPAAACLSSRIAYGVQITDFALTRVERAEVALRAALTAADIPVVNLRVRDLGSDRARIEIDKAVVPKVTDQIVASVIGFASVEVDPAGFRSGSMNEALI